MNQDPEDLRELQTTSSLVRLSLCHNHQRPFFFRYSVSCPQSQTESTPPCACAARTQTPFSGPLQAERCILLHARDTEGDKVSPPRRLHVCIISLEIQLENPLSDFSAPIYQDRSVDVEIMENILISLLPSGYIC